MCVRYVKKLEDQLQKLLDRITSVEGGTLAHAEFADDMCGERPHRDADCVKFWESYYR